ncbi:MAG: hypothetical protein MJY79_00700 [Bacteroidaceae bacterium]|nr:hypothetical protein [Bacteroidaceae bacterium]
MKKLLLLATAAAMMASCSNDFLNDDGPSKPVNPEGPIGFALSSQNMTKASPLQTTGLYSFGVFAYKSTEPTYNMMENYLVGYMDGTNKQGYYMTSTNQTTLGDAAGAANGSSMWAYEKMGNTEYDYTGAEGYYTKDNTRYMSNVDKQYLRYWDKSADYTMFYAYTPYQNASFTGLPAVSYDNSTKTMTIPGGAIHDGYNNPTDNEFMFASAKVDKANYGQDVPLAFKHLVAKCNIKFWEDIDGYSVRILNLSNDFGGVYAVPAIKSSTDVYTLGSYYKTSGANIVFDAAGNGTVSQTNAVAHDLTKTTEALQFAAPVENAIGTTNATASASPTTYYAIPKDATTGGFTFHVSYELTSTTGERITVNNATVWVPDTKCNWQANKHYTYVFKITKNTNGTTDNPGTINPLDPTVSGEAALLPIIFDNCTIEDWDLVDGGEHNIADANTKYYSISLDKGSVVKGTATDVTATLLQRGTAVSSAAGTWSLKKPGATAPETLTAADPKTATVNVGADWATGEYTIIFTPDATMSAPNSTYETKFYVIDAYSVALNANEVGTRGTDKSELTITTDEYAYKAGYLSIEYPSTVTSGDDKNKVRIEGNKVVVMKEAVAGDYKIVYTVGSDVKSSYSFKVVDYALNTGITGNSVGLSQSTQTFNVKTGAPSGSNATLTFCIIEPSGATAGQVTYDATNKQISVTKDATVGQYTLKLVVTNGTSTTTTYERTFEVKDVYELKIYSDVSAGTECYLVDNDTPTDGNPVNLTIVATKNGLKDTTTDLGFTAMTGVSLKADKRTIEIQRNGTPNNYIVSWVVGGKTVAAATLVVTD